MPAWLQGILAIAPPVALAGTSLVSSLLLRLVDCNHLLLVLDNSPCGAVWLDQFHLKPVTKKEDAPTNYGRDILVPANT